MNILEFTAHPDLLGGALDGPSWRPWKSFLRALFDLPMGPSDRTLFRECTGRNIRPTGHVREAALVCGRRAGKSRTLALIAAYLACCRDYRPYLAAGEEAVIAIIAVDRAQAQVIMRFLKGFLKHAEVLEDLIEVEQVETLRLASRVSIEVHSGRIGSPRGRTYAACLLDEIAFWRSDESAHPDKEVVNALRPGLATIPGSLLLMASSPYARRGQLWESYKRYYGRNDAPVLVWQAASRVMNPSLDAAFVQQAYDEDPASAAAEYGAQFRTDVAALITREVVDACVQPGLFERLPEDGITYEAFVDPSGGSSDAMTLAIGHRSRDGTGILDALRERRPPFSPESVVREFADTLHRYNVISVTGDRYSGEWPRERFSEHGIRYVPSERSKSEIYQEVLPLLNAGKVELLDNMTLVNQLVGLERRTARGGKDSIDHGPGAHDDLANAAAGCLVIVGGKASGLELWEKLASGAPYIPPHRFGMFQ